MARPVTPREPAEHVKTLDRMVRQIGIDDKMSKSRRRTVLTKLQEAHLLLKKEAEKS